MRRLAVERRAVYDLIRAESLPNASFAELIEKGRRVSFRSPRKRLSVRGATAA